MKKILLFLSCFCFTSGLLFSETPYPDLKALPEEFFSYSRSTVESGSMYSKPLYGIQDFTIDPQTGNLTFKVETDGYTYSYTTDKSLRMITAHGVYLDEGFIENTGFLEVKARRIEGGAIEFMGKKTNGRWKIKKISHGAEAVFGESASFFFQSVFIQNGGVPVEGTTPTLFFPFSPVNIGYSTTSVPSFAIQDLVGDYPVPDEFKPFLESGRDLLVVETHMEGIAGAFFPHKFNFAYSTEYPYELAAMWGGNYGKSDYFLYIKE